MLRKFKEALEYVMDKIGIYAIAIQWWDLYSPVIPGHYRHIHFWIAQTKFPVAEYAKRRMEQKIRKGINLSPKEMQEEDLKLEYRLTRSFSFGKLILSNPPYFDKTQIRHEKTFGSEMINRNQIIFYQRNS